MVVKMMKWRPWPPLLSRKLEVKLVVKKMEGANCDPEKKDNTTNNNKMFVEIKWKGAKMSLGSFRRRVKKRVHFTRDGEVVEDQNGVVWWDQEFYSNCTLSGYKEDGFLPWEIGFTVLNGSNTGVKTKAASIGKACLNLAEFASSLQEKEFEINIPLIISSGSTDAHPSLHISLSLKETRAESTQSQTQTSETSSEDHSALKAGLRKVNIFKEYVSIKRGKKAARVDDHETRSDDGDVSNLDESVEGIRKSFSYGSLAYANWTGGGSLFEDDVYYRNHKSDTDCSPEEDRTASVSETWVVPNHRRSILPWKKRKLNFRSPKAKGEPLLKKGYGEEGGDDIDFDRRQLSSDESLIGVKSFRSVF